MNQLAGTPVLRSFSEGEGLLHSRSPLDKTKEKDFFKGNDKKRVSPLKRKRCLSGQEILSFDIMAKTKLTASEISILRELIYPEPFDHIQSETGLSYGAIRDDLINLISHGFIEVYDAGAVSSVSPFYDSDQIEKFSFKATKLGLKQIQNHAI